MVNRRIPVSPVSPEAETEVDDEMVTRLRGIRVKNLDFTDISGGDLILAIQTRLDPPFGCKIVAAGSEAGARLDNATFTVKHESIGYIELLELIAGEVDLRIDIGDGLIAFRTKEDTRRLPRKAERVREEIPTDPFQCFNEPRSTGAGVSRAYAGERAQIVVSGFRKKLLCKLP